MVRMELAAEASLAEMRARSRFGIAIEAIIRMMLTTIRSSINEKPRSQQLPFRAEELCGALILNSSR